MRSLLYPLGLVANMLFAIRFLIQWIKSERQGKSTVSPIFWRLSLIANSSMVMHAFIQAQYPICLIQSLNAAIAWRNLNLMRSKSTTKEITIVLMGTILISISCLFFYFNAFTWNGVNAYRGSPVWHAIGLMGMLLFSSRFWVQWWMAEKKQQSYLGKSFWWASLFGASLCLLYFIQLRDPVQILGYSLGIIPYMRNLMLMKTTKTKLRSGLFLFAGEPSADVIGGKLVEALKKQTPSLAISGVGGPLMRSHGMEITHPMERFQVMGFSDVIKALPRLFTDFRKIRNHILKEQPEGVVLIDYPDFNMLLAQSLRKKNYQGKLIHYVCPSVWAWRKKRVHSLAKNLDSLLSILPFEKKCFSQTTLPITYVGHPLVAAIDDYIYDSTFSLPKDKPILALFPGSRAHEIALNLPIQWAIAKNVQHLYTPVISVAKPELFETIKKHASGAEHFVPQDKRYELMKEASFALATSGTIVLEIGLHEVPTIVTYRLARLNYLLGRYLFRIHLPFYTLVNIICEEEVFPEFIHKNLSVEKITNTLLSFESREERCRKQCRELRKRLLNQNASQKAAQTIRTLIQ